MGKSVITGLLALSLSMTLAACGSQSENTSSSTQNSRIVKKADTVSGRQSTTSGESATASSQATTPWNAAKASQLASFMASWGQSMGQQYKSYAPGNSVDFYGVQEPDDLTRMAPAVDEQKISIAWSNTGEMGTEYALVAVYSDAETAPYAGKHLYFFTLRHGQPVVLITMQNQGNENNWLYFKPTANTDLQNGFAKIVNS
ncbi:MAG: DUF4767 domain-containing protein [Lactobacillus sp.]|jgi:hypothetical protein|nr:DUF4767 domain-containing protein [Lactobacillus sp.]MCI2031888.1 DUF4767 domain-containing protein [Lactobacillus sp.]